MSSKETEYSNGSSANDVCLSPSWSEFTSKKKKQRKRQDKERKEIYKSQQKEVEIRLKEFVQEQKEKEQKQAAVAKEMKRLTKKPPGSNTSRPRATPIQSLDAAIRPKNDVRRHTTGAAENVTSEVPSLFKGPDPRPIAKLFVICCKCRFWHDLPSKQYAVIAVPRDPSRAPNEEGKVNNAPANGKAAEDPHSLPCTWCDHGMTNLCCAGWTTVVYLQQRLH